MACANRGLLFQQIDRLYREGTLSGLADSQLLERYLSRRDEAAFEALVNLHGPMVLGLCRRILRDPRDVEDAFQATFMILVRKAPTIRDRDLLSNWLYGVAYRVARRARNNTLRRRGHEIAIANLEATASPVAANSLEIGPALDQELNRLPVKYRLPLILCYLNGRTHDQAAEQIGCPVGTVRSRLARGRDLLRRRLTSRGHAPTAAILGNAAALPARFFTEAVPSSLLSSTVETAIGFAASKTIQASATALALTQGVLTTMKLVQWKLMGTAIMATSVSAGGLIAFSYAAGKNLKGAQSAAVAAVLPSKTQETSNPDLNQLLNRSTALATQAHANAEEPLRPIPIHAPPDEDSRNAMDMSNRSIRELEVELQVETVRARQIQKLAEKKVIGQGELELARLKLLRVKALLQGLDDEFTDELERLELEVEKKKAEVEQVDAQREVALSVVARNARLNERKAGMVDEFSVARAEAELKSALATRKMRQIELKEIQLRKAQLQRRRNRVTQILKLSAEETNRNERPGQPSSAPPAKPQ